MRNPDPESNQSNNSTAKIMRKKLFDFRNEVVVVINFKVHIGAFSQDLVFWQYWDQFYFLTIVNLTRESNTWTTEITDIAKKFDFFIWSALWSWPLKCTLLHLIKISSDNNCKDQIYNQRHIFVYQVSVLKSWLTQKMKGRKIERITRLPPENKF